MSTPKIIKGGGGGVGKGNYRTLRSGRKIKTSASPQTPAPAASAPSITTEQLVNSLKSPPTPHRIQSLNEKSLRLNENDLVFSSITHNAHPNHVTENSTNSAELVVNGTPKIVKGVKFANGEDSKKERPEKKTGPKVNGTKLTDYFIQRRSNRKTQEAINAEKHQLLIKTILDGQQDGLKIKHFGDKGRGVVATKHFLRHEFVVEYAGDLLSSSAAQAREAKYAEDTATGCYMYYFQFNNQQYCVDATKEGDRLGRLINHSRNGNLVTKVVEVKNTPRLILIAKRDIKVDEELTYDYGDRSRDALIHHPWLAY